MSAPNQRSIPVCEPYLGGKEADYVLDCLKTNWISSSGPYLKRFEDEFAQYCGCTHGITTTSGTTALHLVLAAAGCKKGDEIIIPSFTIASTVFAVLYTGATPVLVDVDPDTWTMRADLVAEKISPRTVAIMAVHIYGHPCDMDPIIDLAEKNGILLFEDAAEVHGAEYKGKRCGNFGKAACFSFYANKIISTGEGGMVTTNDDEFAEHCRSLRNLAFGREQRFLHRGVGFNYRMTNIQAAIGLAQLDEVDDYIARRRANAAEYSRRLQDIDGLTLPVERQWAYNVYWMFGLLVQDGFGCSRDELMRRLADLGVETRPFFIPMHEQVSLHELGLFRGETYPVSSDIGRRGLYLPSSTGLSDQEIATVVDAVRDVQKAVR